jgi:hypothetical protein
MSKLANGLLMGLAGVAFLANAALADMKNNPGCVPKDIKKLVMMVKKNPTAKHRNGNGNLEIYEKWFLKDGIVYYFWYRDGPKDRPNGKVDNHDELIIWKYTPEKDFNVNGTITLKYLKDMEIIRDNGWPTDCYMDGTLDGHAIYCVDKRNPPKLMCGGASKPRDINYHKLVKEQTSILESGEYIQVVK